MRLRINGQWQEHPDGIRMTDLVQRLSLHPKRIAVEHNKQLLPRAQHDRMLLADGDELEIVTIAQGG